jgi:hypothetical protein
MPFDNEDDACRAPMTDSGTLPEVRDLASQTGLPCFGWMRLYSRLGSV